jgi:pantothenate kinase type III
MAEALTLLTYIRQMSTRIFNKVPTILRLSSFASDTPSKYQDSTSLGHDRFLLQLLQFIH